MVKRIWTEDSVTHKGRFFETDDCLIYPKPSKLPPLICAGMSDRGFRFTAENCNVAFMAAQDNENFFGRAVRAKEIALEAGNPALKTFGLFSLVIGDTDQQAQEKVDLYNAGVDRVAVARMLEEYNDDKEVSSGYRREWPSRGHRRHQGADRALLCQAARRVGPRRRRPGPRRQVDHLPGCRCRCRCRCYVLRDSAVVLGPTWRGQHGHQRHSLRR